MRIVLINLFIILIINCVNSKNNLQWNRSIEQVHLALTGHESNSMLITFVSKWYGDRIIEDINEIYQWNKECPSPTIEYKIYNETNSIINRVTASSFHYKLSDGYKDEWNGTIHDALMYDLIPNKIYQYRIGIVEDCWTDMTYKLKYTDWYIFQSSNNIISLDNDQSHEYNFVFFGDCGTSQIYNQLAENLQAKVNFTKKKDRHIHLALILGDIPYAKMDGYWDFTIHEYRKHKALAWDNWFYISEKFASSIPVMTLPGNHETLRFDDRQMIPYISRFHMPHGRNSVVRWYSFTKGPIHFIMLSSEHDLSANSQQHNFLKYELNSINRNQIPWIIVAAHRPMYASTIRKGHEGSDMHLRRSIEALLVKYQVDLYLSGHHHAYERTYPLDTKHVYRTHDTRSGIWKGVVHVRAGTGGMQPHRKRMKPYPKYTARRLPGPGYVQVDTKSEKNNESNNFVHTLKLSYVNTMQNRVKDQVTLKRFTNIINAKHEL